jgi:hypothetical protein
LESDELSKEEKKELKKTLKALRVDLHYIIVCNIFAALDRSR